MNEDQVFKLTTKEAIKLIKRAKTGSRFAVHISMDAVVAEDDEHIYSGALRTYLTISKKDALHVVSGCLHKTMEEKGGRIRISIHKTILVRKTESTYWIG